jgi:hypothetical protein
MPRKVRFYAGCPVQGCKNSNSSIYWYHAPDNGKMYIYDDGFLECEDCETKGLIIDWLFDCGDHDYEYASYQGFLNMIAVLGHLEADEDFVDDCLEAGRKQRKRFKGK